MLEKVGVEGGLLGSTVWAEHTGVWLLAGVGANVGFEDALM